VTIFDQSGQVVAWHGFDGELFDLQAYFHDRRIDAGFCILANADGLCAVPVADSKLHRIFINPLLLTAETGFHHSDTLDLAYHEVSHLLEQHHGEDFCGVESKLRQSVRRWMTEREVLASMCRLPRWSCVWLVQVGKVSVNAGVGYLWNAA
jgi:hypothetical protein